MASSNPLSVVPDDALADMVHRAWIEAARCWSEYRREPNGSPIKRMLLTSAEAAETYWSDLLEEQESRLLLLDDRPGVVTDDHVEVSSADVAAVDEDRIIVSRPPIVVRAGGVMSPLVRQNLAAKQRRNSTGGTK